MDEFFMEVGTLIFADCFEMPINIGFLKMPISAFGKRNKNEILLSDIEQTSDIFNLHGV
jgi:hypothetical protein